MNQKLSKYIIPIACFAGGIIITFIVIGFIQDLNNQLNELKRGLLIHEQNIKLIANKTAEHESFNKEVISWAQTIEHKIQILNQTRK